MLCLALLDGGISQALPCCHVGMEYWASPAVHVLIAQRVAWHCLWWIRWHFGKHLKAPPSCCSSEVFLGTHGSTCWLWYPIFYQHVNEFTPLPALAWEYPHLCKQMGWHTTGVSDLCFYVSQISERCHNLAGVPGHTRLGSEVEKRAKETGGHQEPAQHSGQMFREGHCKFQQGKEERLM